MAGIDVGQKMKRVESTPARLAQSVERTALNRVVVGSSPTAGDFFFF